MVNSVTEKFPIQSNNLYYTNFCTGEKNQPKVVLSNGLRPQDNELNIKKKRKSAFVPLSLITGGGALMVFGLKKTSPKTLVDRVVSHQSAKIETGLFGFSLDVKAAMGNLVKTTVEYINKFAKKRLVKPDEGLDIIRSLNNPKRLILAQDVSLEAVRNIDRLQYRLGASDIDNFGQYFDKISSEEGSNLHHKRRILGLELKDSIRVTTKHPDKNAGLIRVCEDKLAEILKFRCDKADKFVDSEIAMTKKSVYLRMTSIIIEGKQRILQRKMNIIDATYERMRQLLGIEDLKPSYHTIPDASCIKKLKPEQLKPTALPPRLEKEATYNAYLKAIETKDFNNLSDKDLGRILYSAGEDNTLQDLAFLIDRLRLRHVVGEAQKSDNVSLDNVIITKLQYLSAKLNDFGKRELLKALGKDFDGPRMEGKRANIYYINRIAKILGFNSIAEVDKVMLKEYPEYAKFSIRKYIKIFEENPDLYYS